MSIEDEVLALVHEVPRPPGEGIPGGATPAAIDALGKSMGRPVPQELQAWLLRCNCPRVGPGGVYGVCPDDDYVDIAAKYRLRPHWLERGWVPVAGDGCGNYYVLDLARRTRSGHPVLFLDWEDSSDLVCDTPSYVVASGLWPFLRYLLLGEKKAAYNIWDEEEALREDPGLADVEGVLRPWETLPPDRR